MRFPSADERDRLKAARVSAWPKLYLLVVMALVTGARRGELLALRWRDINLEAAPSSGPSLAFRVLRAIKGAPQFLEGLMSLLPATKSARSPLALLGAALVLAGVTAAWVQWRARRAERDNPPAGEMLDIDGVQLHYVERGAGPPVVLIHGNLVWHRDFIASQLIERLARNHRVIAFDRPGFGHSTRPRDRPWTPSAQGKLLHAACARLGVERPVLVGHSMGSMVAMAMALDYPASIRKLVLLGGYYYPSMRVDALLAAPVAVPVLGNVMSNTVTAVSVRLLLKKMVKALFAPKEVPAELLPTLSSEMLLRPSQLRANAEDAAFMNRQARSNSERHQQLQLPVAIFAGAEDSVIDVESHSQRLHDELFRSTLRVVPGVGHMVHYAAVDEIATAIDADLLDDTSLTQNVLTPIGRVEMASPT